MTSLKTLLAVGALALSVVPARPQAISCLSPARPMLHVELMFGRAMSGRRGVTDARWRAFVAKELTPRFPDGLTVLDAQGQWRDPRGVITRERSKLVIIVIADDASAPTRLAEVAAVYKRQFKQQSVGVITHPVCAEF